MTEFIRSQQGDVWSLECPKLGRKATYRELYTLVPWLSPTYMSWEHHPSVCLVYRLMTELWIAPYVAVALYCALIYWAKQRPISKGPTKLKYTLGVWNASLALFSLFGTFRTVPYLLWHWNTKGFESAICESPITAGWGIGTTGLWVQYFVLSKFIELGDTCFLIYNQRDVVFLHWFHHASTLYFSWFAYVHEASYALFFIAMNYSVHSVMYAYFAGRAFGIVPSWFPASLITVAQISQMIAGVTVQVLVWMKTNGACAQVHNPTLWVGTAMYGTYCYLFVDFLFARIKRLSSNKKKKV